MKDKEREEKEESIYKILEGLSLTDAELILQIVGWRIKQHTIIKS